MFFLCTLRKSAKTVSSINIKIVFNSFSNDRKNLILYNALNHFALSFSEIVFILKTHGNSIHISYEGIENIGNHKNKHPQIYISNHSGNVFIPSLGLTRLKTKINVLVNFSRNLLFQKSFNLIYKKFVESLIWKSPQVGFQLNRLLQQKKNILIFTDQNENNGIILPFFGKPARTGTAVPRLAMKYNCPVIPIQTIRTGDQSYIIRFHKPMYPNRNLPKKEAIIDFLMRINKLYESWIREHPEQYLWLHRRFIKELYHPERVNEYNNTAS